MNMTGVSSSMISSVGYDPDTRKLRVKMRARGTTYEYDDVTQEDADKLTGSNSCGKCFHNDIRPKYPKFRIV
jgi:hypothetical protein